MFVLIGFILRLPWGLIKIALSFLVWPIVVGFYLFLFCFSLVVAPFELVSAAFSNKRRKWDEFCKESFNMEPIVNSIFFRLIMTRQILRWILTGSH